MEGYILLHRKMVDWEWYGNVNTCMVFLHCLFKANWKPCKWQGIEIQAGQFVTSLPNMARETGLSVQQIRTAIKHLKSTGEITDKSYTKFRLITVNNWCRYQLDNRQTNSQLTDNQQATNRQLTAIEEIKESNKEINKRFVPPTVDEVKAYCQERNNQVDPERFVDFYESKNWMIGKNKMKDWKAAVRTWEKKDNQDKKPKNKFNNFDSRSMDFSELERVAFGE